MYHATHGTHRARRMQTLDTVHADVAILGAGPAGAWAAWDRDRLAKTGGAQEQYKHPCLIGDTAFKDTMRVVREIT